MGLVGSGICNLRSALVRVPLAFGQNGRMDRLAGLGGRCLVPHGAHGQWYGHTGSARAEARSRFEAEHRLRTVNKMLPANVFPSNLLGGEPLDNDHVAATARATPSDWGLVLASSERL
jgi:hypothetical protein